MKNKGRIDSQKVESNEIKYNEVKNKKVKSNKSKRKLYVSYNARLVLSVVFFLILISLKFYAQKNK